MKDGAWGYIDVTGRVVIPFRFQRAGRFHEGLAPVQAGGMWGFADPAGRMVISDRYVDSTLAFQTVSREEADALYESFLAEIRVPDITFILECSVEVGLERIYESRGRLTKFEDFETLENARNIYASRSGDNYCALDACGTIQETLQQALIAFGERFSHSLSLEECYSDLGIQLPYAQSTLKSAAGS